MSQISRYDPFDDLFRGLFVRPVDFGGVASGASSNALLRVDISDADNQFILRADLPGIKKDNINVSIDGNVVSISAESRTEKEMKAGEKVLRAERYFGQVSRSFQLPQEVEESTASAKFEDGVLTLTLPKKMANAAKRLTIN